MSSRRCWSTAAPIPTPTRKAGRRCTSSPGLDGRTAAWPILSAVPTGTLDSLELAKTLLAHGANPDARLAKDRNLGLDDRHNLNRVGATPFLLAAKSGDVEMMRVLVAHGADPSLADRGSVDAVDGGGRRRRLECRRERRHERGGARGRQDDTRPGRRRQQRRTTTAIPRCTAPLTAAPTPSCSCWSTRAPGSTRG